MYLNKSDSNQVASIITSLIVSREAWFDAVDRFVADECGYDKVKFWQREYHKDIVALSKFGIKMHSLDESIRMLEVQ